MAADPHFPEGITCYRNLMPRRIERVLLVGNKYDAFILKEAGFGDAPAPETTPYSERMPQCIAVESGREALEFLSRSSVDLVLTDYVTGDMNGFELSDEIKRRNPAQRVVLLTSKPEYLQPGLFNPNRKRVDWLFRWMGELEILRTMIWLAEDQMNADADLGKGLLRYILMVEDEPMYYSLFLPALYDRIRRATLALTPKSASFERRQHIFKCRIRVILAEDVETAEKTLSNFQDQLIGMISDLQLPNRGKMDLHAGLHLLRRVKARDDRIPAIILTNERELEPAINEAKGIFLWKGAEGTLHNLKRYLKLYFGFGDFIFRDQHNREVARAKTLEELVAAIRDVDLDIFVRHASQNHFSTWLYVHGYHALAQAIRPIHRPEDPKRFRDETLAVLQEFLDAELA
jgi:CheY-like chemotaxis protein